MSVIMGDNPEFALDSVVIRLALKEVSIGEKFKADDGVSPNRAHEAGQRRNFP